MARAQLTGREAELLQLAVAGRSNEEIAALLAISRRTVEAHMRTLFRKMGVTRRSQLAALWPDGNVTTGPAVLAMPGQRPDLENYQRQLRRYADAVHGLVDRQFPLFEESVELTLVVGDQDGQDIVVERRRTTPRPYLVYRIVGPIVAWPQDSPFQPEDLELACHVHSQDVHVDIHLVPDKHGRPLVMILFQPGLQVETEWSLRYRSPRLWSPLRSSGEDTLSWATATFDQRHPASPSELSVKVIFPDRWAGERLIERSDFGTIRTERLPTGQAQFTWCHDPPHAGTYHWLLRGSRGPET